MRSTEGFHVVEVLGGRGGKDLIGPGLRKLTGVGPYAGRASPYDNCLRRSGILVFTVRDRVLERKKSFMNSPAAAVPRPSGRTQAFSNGGVSGIFATNVLRRTVYCWNAEWEDLLNSLVVPTARPTTQLPGFRYRVEAASSASPTSTTGPDISCPGTKGYLV